MNLPKPALVRVLQVLRAGKREVVGWLVVCLTDWLAVVCPAVDSGWCMRSVVKRRIDARHTNSRGNQPG